MSLAVALPPPRIELRASLYAVCRPFCLRHPEGAWIARMLASWWADEGALPVHLGLSPQEYLAFCQHYLGRAPLLADPPAARRLAPGRLEEREELKNLLLAHGRDDAPRTAWLATIVASASLGENHLWQDLGLWRRDDLSALLFFAFPELARQNVNDMKWKKFFYRRMCENEGLRLCRAPSCGVCTDYERCFGTEI